MTHPTSQRIHSIDAVRAVALLGILLVHAHDYFNLAGPGAQPVGIADAPLNFIYGNILVSRAFMIFSFLFGLSFFLQMDHARARGQRFAARFCWRLFLLAGFGVIHSFFYNGDILIIFAITGYFLVSVWRVPSWLIACLAGVFLLQPLALYHAITGTPEAMSGWAHQVRCALGCTSAPDYQAASFWEIGVWNLRSGIINSFLYTTYSYRIWSILAMFLLGLLAGRTRLFEGARSRLYKVAGISAALWLAVVAFRLIPGTQFLSIATDMWERAAFVGACTPLLALLVSKPGLSKAVFPLTQIGRCTLTCYISQSIILCWALCGYGLGLCPVLSVTGVMLLALAVYVGQVVFCTYWLKHFRYGPLEGVWRRLTRIGLPSPQTK